MSDGPASLLNPKRDVEDSEIREEETAPKEADGQLEKQLVRKLDMVIMPLTCALYLFAYLDRSNLG
jgi:hypothetical protein